ncbi:hypothetical protein BC938DRAFT_479377, partial [Jimgerdemannia flammicorona]
MRESAFWIVLHYDPTIPSTIVQTGKVEHSIDVPVGRGRTERFAYLTVLWQRPVFAGRGTIVWTARRKGDVPNRIYVIKDSWRPTRYERATAALRPVWKQRGCPPLVDEHHHGYEVRIGKSSYLCTSFQSTHSLQNPVPLNLLRVLRDGIDGHRCLFSIANILHRDTPVNNIVVDEQTGRGFIIDLDYAICTTDTERPLSGVRTGTTPFMAIDVLEGTATRAYRHDMKSFFYVFLWVAWRQERRDTLSMWKRG